ncbi:MAG: M20/M25/M40 family metallo-hydrolase [Rhodopirellula sp.]|nr:M20/M25/M40 family metallo-hydrolase [Rhodopirellula sp.]
MTSDDSELASRLTALTRDLILIPTTDSRPAERERCFEFIQNHLDSLGSVQITSYESKGYRSLVVGPQTSEPPEILLCGHIDVIEHPDPDSYHSAIRDGRIYGPGAGDMKGADAIMLELFRTMHARHPGISLGLALTSDEEIGGKNGVRFLVEEAGLQAGIVIVPDGGSLNEVTIEEKGVLHLRVRREGHSAHGARPWLGTNALELLLERVTALRSYFAENWPIDKTADHGHWYPTCSLNIVETPNESANRIPSEASATLDIRFPPPHTVGAMLDNVASILGADCYIEPLMTADPCHLDSDPIFCEVTEAITGNPVKLIRAAGASDSRFFRKAGIPVNLSRPLVGNLHGEDEWIDINSMVTYYWICQRYIEQKLHIS